MPTDPPQKILAIQFRYFGDLVLATPALRAIREHWPACELHLLVPAETTPLVERLPCLTKVWPLPRQRGRAQITASWPLIRALRAERFDRSVDFGGNDRGAILSRLCGARERLAPFFSGGFFGRRFCYTRLVAPAPRDRHETLRSLHILSAWGVGSPRSLETEIHADPALDGLAASLLPEPKILCHLATSQPKKEWPLTNWAALHRLAARAGLPLVFSTGTGAREEALLAEFKKLAPDAAVLPPVSALANYLALLRRARIFVSGDTGPLHFAAGVGVPTLALFGATPPELWAPLGPRHRLLVGSPCSCSGNVGVCRSATPCLAAISPAAVLTQLLGMVEARS